MDGRFSHDSDSEHDVDEILNREPNDPNTIITFAPEQRFRLGYLSVIGLVVNRMIGTLAIDALVKTFFSKKERLLGLCLSFAPLPLSYAIVS